MIYQSFILVTLGHIQLVTGETDWLSLSNGADGNPNYPTSQPAPRPREPIPGDRLLSDPSESGQSTNHEPDTSLTLIAPAVLLPIIATSWSHGTKSEIQRLDEYSDYISDTTARDLTNKLLHNDRELLGNMRHALSPNEYNDLTTLLREKKDVREENSFTRPAEYDETELEQLESWYDALEGWLDNRPATMLQDLLIGTWILCGIFTFGFPLIFVWWTYKRGFDRLTKFASIASAAFISVGTSTYLISDRYFTHDAFFSEYGAGLCLGIGFGVPTLIWVVYMTKRCTSRRGNDI